MNQGGPLADLDRALRAATAIIAGIRPDQWSAPTVVGVDTRALTAHVVAGNLLFVALLRDGALPAAGTLGDDVLVPDPVAAFRRAGAELAWAFAAEGVLARPYTAPPGALAPSGTVPGIDLLHVRLVEILVHGWDIARATGQPAGFPDDLADRVLTTARRFPKPPPGPGSPFGPEMPVPAGAPAIDRLAGFLGREV
ncbi:MAG TPA: TIGR03086 family metal-binding protein [Trebonia sp.]|jgi:uncharacterized protein (TIGR03086 family)|nr:TIGR03086 family metal-binding protein [Trebonia sp.]